MRVLVFTALFLFYFFTAPACEAHTLLITEKKEAHFSADRTIPEPAADNLHGAPNLHTVTPVRRHLPPGGIELSSLVMRQATTPVPLLIMPGKKAFCIPIALRLLFPRHYFW